MSQATKNVAAPRLRLYREQAAAELTRTLSFWQQQGVDTDYGGFIGQLNQAGERQAGAPKGGVLNARILWTFSAAYRQSGNPAYLSLATRAFDYLRTRFLDAEYGGMYWAVDFRGNLLNDRKQVYGLAFAVYGLSEYYRISREPEALQAAQDLYAWIERFSFDPEHGGYLEAFSREGVLLEDLRLSAKDRNDPKTMNTHLHILEAYASLYSVWPDTGLQRNLEQLLEVFLCKITDPATGHLRLFFTRDWQSTSSLVSYGHDIEASWLLWEAAEISGNQVLMQKVKQLSVRMARVTAANLQADGSLYHEFDSQSRHADKHREWWVSAEAMVGFMNAFQLTGEAAFLDHSLGAWHFTQNHLLDMKRGEWFWGVYDDYSLMQQEDKIGFWKCPYHNGRACLEIIRRIQLLE